MKLKNFFYKVRPNQEPSQEFSTKLKESLVIYIKNNPPVSKMALFKNDAVGFPWQKTLTISFAALALLCTSAIGTVFAAQKALPGDTLYGIKLAVDQLSITVSSSPSARIAIADRRLEEVKQILGAQTDQNTRTQNDVQNALRQYQSNLQNVMTAISATSSLSSTSTVQNILQTTVDNETDLKQLIAKNESEGISQNLKSSLQFSEQTVTAARANLNDFETETSTKNAQSDSHVLTARPIAPAHLSSSTISTSDITRNSTETSTQRTDFQNSEIIGSQELESILQKQNYTSTLTSTSTSTSTIQATTSTSSEGHDQQKQQNNGNEWLSEQIPKPTSTISVTISTSTLTSTLTSTSTSTSTIQATTSTSSEGHDQQKQTAEATIATTTTSFTLPVSTSTVKALTSTSSEVQNSSENGDNKSTKENQD